MYTRYTHHHGTETPEPPRTTPTLGVTLVLAALPAAFVVAATAPEVALGAVTAMLTLVVGGRLR